MQELMFLNKNYFQFVCQFQPCYVTQNTIKIDENKTPQIFFITFYRTKMYTSYIFLSIEDSRFIKQAVITDSIRSSTLGCLDNSSFQYYQTHVKGNLEKLSNFLAEDFSKTVQKLFTDVEDFWKKNVTFFLTSYAKCKKIAYFDNIKKTTVPL